MVNITKNYSIVKPDLDNAADIELVAEAIDMIDETIKTVEENVEGLPIKSLAGQTVEPESGTTVTAGEGATIIGNLVERDYNTISSAREDGNNYVYVGNIASGMYATVAGGDYNTASGTASFAMGTGNIASGFASFAMGNRSTSQSRNTASGDVSFAMGKGNTASGDVSFAMGENNVAGTHGFNIAIGRGNNANSNGGGYAIGYMNTVTGQFGTAIGAENEVTGLDGIAAGHSNTVSQAYSAAFGAKNMASGYGSIATGKSTTASGNYSFTTGEGTIASGTKSVAVGNYNTAAGILSSVFGTRNTALAYQFKCGHYAKDGTAGTATDTTGDAFIIGNGTASEASNAFRVTYAGKTYGLQSFAATGADYAELFEWADGNPDNEDRRGRFVTLDGEKIRFATADDDYILGVISATPCLVGDNYADDWHGKYLTDAFGERLTQIVHMEAEYEEIETIDPETGEKTTEKILIHDEYDAVQWILNPDYNEEDEYIPREERPEWSYVGSMGKLVVVDDGSCEPNGYCCAGENGVATKATSANGYRVMERLDENHIRIWVR